MSVTDIAQLDFFLMRNRNIKFSEYRMTEMAFKKRQQNFVL